MNPTRTWRLLVAASGATGVLLAAQRYDVWWTALSQLSNLAVALGFLVLAFREPRSPWLRGALTSTMLLVMLAYLPMANGNLTQAWSVVEHVLTPGLVLADFLLVRRPAAVRWWHPLTWLVAPSAYLAWYVAGDLHTYAALDPASGWFVPRVGVLLALLLGSGYALWLVGRERQSRQVWNWDGFEAVESRQNGEVVQPA